MLDTKIEQSKVNKWEVPSIDLNLRHYSGSVSDVFKKIKYDIVNYLMNPNVSKEQRKIYSAIYNALDYYEVLSPDFLVDSDFLSSSIQTFNEDLSYLSQKYNSDNPLDGPVVSINARIKSPLSFVEKVKDKVNEYIEKNRDFAYFNESLRDIIGVRVIIDPPYSVKAQGFQAESDYLYAVFYDLMTYRGILDESQSSTPVGKFRFLDVNTRYNSHKLQEIKENEYSGQFIPSTTIPTPDILRDLSNYEYLVKPVSRPAYIEKIDDKVKDYHLYPKKSGYQSLHICVVPYYSANVKKPELPTCIIPPATSDYSIEYQFRDARENDFSDKGPASHKNLKPFEKVYHRLAVPSFIAADDPTFVSTSTQKFSNLLKARNFGENYQRFYGPSFEDKFNINYLMFNYTFDEKTQNDILAGTKTVIYNPITNTYYAKPASFSIFIESSDKKDFATSIFQFIEESHMSDSNLVPTETNGSFIKKSRGKNDIKVYKFISFPRKKKKILETTSIDEKKASNGLEFDDNL